MRAHLRPRRCLLAVSALLALVTGCGKQPAGAPVATSDPHQLTVYVPCGMELPFAAAKGEFERSHPGKVVNVVLDNGNILVHRVLDRGETPDMIVSPGTLEMQMLEKAGAVVPGTSRPFGRFELMLFAPRDNPGNVHAIADLAKPSVEMIAIADPDKNSVGAYTKQALQALGLWDQLKPKMTFWDHPITAYQHVARGKAQASFAYRSCPLKTAPEKLAYSRVRILEPVPPATYGPAFATIGILAKAAHPDLAQQFLALLLSPEGQQMLDTHDIPALPHLTVSVPCGMNSPLEDLCQTFQKSHPGVLLNVVAEATDASAKTALPDIRILVGKGRVDRLVKAGELEAGSVHPVGTLQLALCVPRRQAKAVTRLHDLTKPEVKRVLLPAEKEPAAQYARQVLEMEGLWETVKGKVSYGSTVRDCYRDLVADKADAGFAYLGCPVPTDPGKADYAGVKTVLVLKQDRDGATTAYAARSKTGRYAELADQLLTFLLQPTSATELAVAGLVPPTDVSPSLQAQ